eukprot:scaffold54668_cov66-Phaeocystis_antarctica.AAC.4
MIRFHALTTCDATQYRNAGPLTPRHNARCTAMIIRAPVKPGTRPGRRCADCSIRITDAIRPQTFCLAPPAFRQFGPGLVQRRFRVSPS